MQLPTNLSPRTSLISALSLFLAVCFVLWNLFSSSSPIDSRPSIHLPSSHSSSGITTYFITASSRGIGLEVVAQLAKDPNARVVAAGRTPEASEALQKLLKDASSAGRVRSVALDVSSAESIRAMLVEVDKIDFIQEHGISVLLHVAGVMSGGFGLASQITPSDLLTDTLVNFHAPILLTQALMPLLSRPHPTPSSTFAPLRKIYVLSSILGSMDSFPEMKGYSAAYSATKVAVDMWVRKLSWELANRSPNDGEEGKVGGWVVGSIHPGFVRTDMTRGRGDIDVGTSAKGVIKTLAAVTEEHTGRFFDWEGREMGW